MTVLLIGIGHAGEFDLLAEEIEKKGHDAVLINVQNWPGGSPLSLEPGKETAIFGEEIDLETVRGAYIVPHHLLHPFENRIRDRLLDDFDAGLNQIREYRAMFEGLCGILDSRSRNVIVPLQNHYLQDRKPYQLEVLAQLDVPTPETVFTTDPSTVKEFVEDHTRVIYKPVTRGGKPYELTEEDLTQERLEHLETAPVQFQAFAPGDDVRVFVVDGTVVGAVKYTSDSFSFKLAESENVQKESITVPTHIKKIVKEATNEIGLTLPVSIFDSNRTVNSRC
ncbi:hypothetical protein GJ629_03130 [Halapricum sp. CBA1109]|uniref:ATP-grasp domain-containing protein n=1 Tax=Halapricum sp. CBA1109 TaxID=2668068 RepID=UPI0012FAC37B|nr:hypothetical protein [Halapricum sp. CBA1109]MUV89009.1 hypothetical protein [Halapricum sp. CBA1109]